MNAKIITNETEKKNNTTTNKYTNNNDIESTDGEWFCDNYVNECSMHISSARGHGVTALKQ